MRRRERVDRILQACIPDWWTHPASMLCHFSNNKKQLECEKYRD